MVISKYSEVIEYTIILENVGENVWPQHFIEHNRCQSWLEWNLGTYLILI